MQKFTLTQDTEIDPGGFKCVIDGPHMTMTDVLVDLANEKIAELKAARDSACKTVADMHAAAMGEVRGPVRGVVEDVADLRTAFETLQVAHDFWKKAALEALELWIKAEAALKG